VNARQVRGGAQASDYRYAQDTCLELDLKSTGFGVQVPGLQDSGLAHAFDARH